MATRKSDHYVYVYMTEKGGRIRYGGKEILISPEEVYYVGRDSGAQLFLRSKHPEYAKIQNHFGRKVLVLLEDLSEARAYFLARLITLKLSKIHWLMNCYLREKGEKGEIDLEVLEVHEHEY